MSQKKTSKFIWTAEDLKHLEMRPASKEDRRRAAELLEQYHNLLWEPTVGPNKRAALERARPVLASFQRTFGRPPAPDFLAELYAADRLGLRLDASPTNPGSDATDRTGKRYQIKLRAPGTHNVDISDPAGFDYLVLVNLDAHFRVSGMWRLSSEQVRAVAKQRPKYHRYQAPQAMLKEIGEKLA